LSANGLSETRGGKGNALHSCYAHICLNYERKKATNVNIERKLTEFYLRVQYRITWS